MGWGPYGDDSMSDEDYEQAMDQMMELQEELREPHDASTDRMLREELEDLSSAMLFEPVMENGRFVGYRDHEPGYWTNRRDQPEPESEPEPEPEPAPVDDTGASGFAWDASTDQEWDASLGQQDESAEFQAPAASPGARNSGTSSGGSGCLYVAIGGFIAFLVFIGILDTIYDHVLVPAGFAMRRIDFQQFVIFGFIAIWLVVRHLRKKRRK